jgi:hypothetical protein
MIELDDHDRFAGRALQDPAVRAGYRAAAFERGVAEGRRQVFESEARQLDRMADMTAGLGERAGDPDALAVAAAYRHVAERFRNKLAKTAEGAPEHGC